MLQRPSNIQFRVNKAPSENIEGAEERIPNEENPDQQQQQAENSDAPILPCTININVSGASGQILTDAENEITRIFQSGGILVNIVFSPDGKPNPGSPNLIIVSAFTGEAAAAIQRQGRGVDPNSILGVTPTMGNSVYVNQTGIGAFTVGLKGFGASIGTMIGRVGAHELIQHRLLGILPEGTLKDITSSKAVTPRALRAAFTTRFNLNPLTAAMLSNRCRP
jgi:hypothetical protein